MTQLEETERVDILILGAGWTATFLIPMLKERQISYAATTREGRDSTIRWTFEPAAPKSHYYCLPQAKTVLIIFPIKTSGEYEPLVRNYEELNGAVKWIQLGSTGIWDGGPTLRSPSQPRQAVEGAKWYDRHSEWDRTNQRGLAEEELLKLSPNTYVLNLCGLWGGVRNPLNWLKRVGPNKEALEKKGSVHFVHGDDVSNAIILVHNAKTPPSPNRRYIVTDLRIYDWWDIASSTGTTGVKPDGATVEESEMIGSGIVENLYAVWVRELMVQHGVMGLPRTPEQLGRAMDGREFWTEFGGAPIRGRWQA